MGPRGSFTLLRCYCCQAVVVAIVGGLSSWLPLHVFVPFLASGVAVPAASEGHPAVDVIVIS